VSGNKSYAQISSKQERLRSKKNLQNFELFFKNIFFLYIIFFSTNKALIHSTWICYEKVMDNLVFQAILASS